MKKKLCTALYIPALLALLSSCTSGATDVPDLDFGAEDSIAVLYGTMYYNGDLDCEEIVVAIVDEWPMTGPPKEYARIEPPDGAFPLSYSLSLGYTGTFYVIAYMDVDTTDSSIFNADIDPMMLPLSESDTHEITEGNNPVDLLFVDSDELDWWWL